MFGFGKAKKEATQVGEAAARAAMMPFWDMFARAFDTRVWSDPYLLGVIHGSIAAQTLPIAGRQLSVTDRGLVIISAMTNLGANRNAIELAMRLGETKDPDFARGYDHALTTFGLMDGLLKREAYSDPDIIAAQEAVPVLRKAAASFAGVGPRPPNEELAGAYIYLRVKEHKDRRYPK